MNIKRASKLTRIVVLLVALAWSSLAFCGEVHQAAQDGDLKKVAGLIKDAPKLVFSRDEYGMTPLHWAAFKGHVDVAKLLLTEGADVNAMDNGWANAGSNVVTGSNVVMVQETHDAKEKSAWTPLHFAAAQGNQDVVKLLLTKGAHIEAKDNIGETPLILAAKSGHVDVVKLLLTEGADLNARDKAHGTPLSWAAGGDNKDVVELLLAKGAKVNSRGDGGMTPLHEAALNGRKAVVEALLAHGAEVNARMEPGRGEKTGETPLDLARSKDDKELVELLRQHGGRE